MSFVLTLPLVLLLISSSFTLGLHVYLCDIFVSCARDGHSTGGGWDTYAMSMCLRGETPIYHILSLPHLRYWYIWLHIYHVTLIAFVDRTPRSSNYFLFLFNRQWWSSHRYDTRRSVSCCFCILLFLSFAREVSHAYTALFAPRVLFIRQTKWWNADAADISKGSVKGKWKRDKWYKRLN